MEDKNKKIVEKIDQKVEIAPIEPDKDNIKNKNKTNINNIDDVNKILIDATFRLRVVVQGNTIFGEPYDPKKNTFYLSLEKLDPNCSIGDNDILDSCKAVFLDNKNCDSKFLYNFIKENNIPNYRLVLVQEDICNNESINIGKNTKFTFVKDKDKFYLKNLDQNMYINLFKNDKNFILTGEILNNAVSNIDKMDDTIFNSKCKPEKKKNDSSTQFVTCSVNNDFNY